MLPFLIFFLSIPLFAREGLYYLNSFPETDQFAKVSFGAMDSEIEADELNFSSHSKGDLNLAVRLLWGKKINPKSFFTIELPYFYTEENSRKYDGSGEERLVARGFREPEVSWRRRIRHKKDQGDLYSDMSFSFIPKLLDKKVGTEQANKWSGKNVFKAKISTGALYDKYEARIGANYVYHAKAQEERAQKKATYTFSDYNTIQALLELQYMADETWWFFLNSGIGYIEDYDIKYRDNKTTIQQGTGSFGDIGAKYLVSAGFYTFKISYRSNDYFASSQREGNFRGSFYQIAAILSYTANL